MTKYTITEVKRTEYDTPKLGCHAYVKVWFTEHVKYTSSETNELVEYDIERIVGSHIHYSATGKDMHRIETVFGFSHLVKRDGRWVSYKPSWTGLQMNEHDRKMEANIIRQLRSKKFNVLHEYNNIPY